MFIQEHNCETGEITQRPLSAEEITQRETEAQAEAEARAAKAQAKAELLAQLGITEEQAKLLLS
jgi:hypothetical protein